MAHGEGTEVKKDSSKPKVRVIAPIEGPEKRAQMAPIKVTESISRMCTYHPNIPAIYICTKCSKSMCISCALPYGHLFLCPQCYTPPKPMEVEKKKTEPKKPPLESIMGLFGALLIIVGFFLPWATSDYQSPDFEEHFDSVISGFTIAGDYPDVSLVFIMAILIVIIEFLLLILSTSPMFTGKPPIGIRLLPMFLCFIVLIVLIEILFRAESLMSNIHVGWFVCLFGAAIILFGTVMEIWKHYKGIEE
ncbi:MAG: B-box zinc finger protein [Thermoplasmata archaeon]|nr:MAG: B-box zinc finger protein [Thermoplasmata archaeon]